MEPTPATRPPTTDFALRTLAVVLAIGVAAVFAVSRAVQSAMDDQLAFHAEFVVDTIAAPMLEDGTDRGQVLGDVVNDDPQVLAVSLLGPGREVVAGAGGPIDERESSRHEVPVPGSDLVAAVQQDASAVAATARSLTTRIGVVLGVGLLALWVAILPLARRLRADLSQRTEQLAQQHDQLERLLGREQATVQRLRELDELRERFLTSVSHELRTPLTVVLGALRTLTSHGAAIDASTRDGLVERAADHADRLDQLLAGLLALNQGADGPHDHELVDVADAVEDARAQLPPRAVELDLEVEALVTDRRRFVRAVTALLSNAIRHAPGDHPVVVRTRTDGTDVEVQVDDRGPGIPADLRHAVFEPFRQGELNDAHSPGTGIGLALVAAFAAEHGGMAWASDRPGGGARIHLTLAEAVGSTLDVRDVRPRAQDGLPAPAAESTPTDPVGTTRQPAATPPAA